MPTAPFANVRLDWIPPFTSELPKMPDSALLREQLESQAPWLSAAEAVSLLKVAAPQSADTARTLARHLETAAEAMGLITGQKPIITIARKAISAFRLREGMQIGCKVTLRGR